MNAVLGLDTSERTAGAAVVVDGAVRYEAVEASGPRQSRRILTLVEAALAAAGVGRSDLVAVAVTVGPGAFTGVRVGVATAKGLAVALGIPVVGVSSLEALAGRAGPWPGLVAPVLDAKKRQVYAGAWEGDTGRRVLDEAAWDPTGLGRALAETGRPVLVLGAGVAPYREVLRSSLGDRYHEAPEDLWTVPPARVALLGWQRWRAGSAEPPDALTPRYLRRSEAEERKAGKLGG